MSQSNELTDMSSTILSVNYDGSALDTGEMDVAELAPALLALGKLFEEANRVINGDKSKISVKVRSEFRKGSFELDIHISLGWLSHIRDILVGPNATAIFALCGFLGITLDVRKGLFWLIKKARGRAAKRAIRLQDGNIELIFPADAHSQVEEKVTVDAETLRLFRDLKVRKYAEQSVKPLERRGIDCFSMRPAGTEKKEAPVIVKKTDLSYFQTPEVTETLLVTSPAEVAYTIINISFTDDGKWKLNDGQSVVWASIDDKEFKEKVNKGEVAFVKGDILVCDVIVQQWQTDSGLKTETHIEKVKSHLHPKSSQIEMPFE